MSQVRQYRLPLTARPERYEIELSVDVEDARFSGTETVTLDVLEPTGELVLNAVGLSIDEAAVETPEGRVLASTFRLDEEDQRLTVVPGEELATGEGYRLRLVFNAPLDEQLRGLYRSTFTDSSGSTHTIASTQFEATDARRAFPCWDEPAFKAVFSITLVVPEEMTALSNGAEVATEHLGDGRKRVRFSDTMRMSTYLVAFVVGPFELTDPIDVDGTPLRVASVPGKSHLTGFAVEAGAHALRFLSNYFQIPYPDKKIDHVGIPDFSFGAMENLGCVTYRENSLLVDPERASQLELQRVATVVAHETAHMWFGDLVTMKWWNGVWLNEAFATFMELLTTDDFDPSWQVWNGFAASRSAALVTDGLRATRPVEFAVEAPEEADAMFDILTYQKGGAVLRMMEQYLGPETFRKGIGHYLRTHAFGNTEADDLWDALETVSGEAVRSVMRSWIHQGGHPVVSVEQGPERSSLRLNQKRFLYDGSESHETWVVPVSLRASVAGAVQNQRMLLGGEEDTVSFDGPVDWVIINDGASGFYRANYAPELLGALLERDICELCSPLERFDLLADAWAGVVAGISGLTEWSRLARVLADDDDADVWAALASVTTLLRSLADGGDDAEAVRAFARDLASPAWERLGWEPRPGEDRRVGTARARVLTVLGLVAEEEGIDREAAERVDRYVAGRASELSADVVSAALRIFVATGGDREWSLVADQYRRNDNPQEKLRFLYALAETRDPSLVKRTLDLADGIEVRSQDAPFLIGAVLAQPSSTRAAWDWIVVNWERVTSRFPASLVLRIFESLLSVSDSEVSAQVHEFCATRHLPMSGPRLDQILERLDVNVALAARLRGDITGLLQP